MYLRHCSKTVKANNPSVINRNPQGRPLQTDGLVQRLGLLHRTLTKTRQTRLHNRLAHLLLPLQLPPNFILRLPKNPVAQIRRHVGRLLHNLHPLTLILRIIPAPAQIRLRKVLLAARQPKTKSKACNATSATSRPTPSSNAHACTTCR
jgi:hypothetical protein